MKQSVETLGVLEPVPVQETGMFRVVDLAGGVKALADKLGVSRQAVYMWLQRGFAPPVRAIQMEEIYRVSRADLMDPAWLFGTLKEATSDQAHRPYRPRRRT